MTEEMQAPGSRRGGQGEARRRDRGRGSPASPAYYLLGSHAAWLRWVAVVAGLAVAALAAGVLALWQRVPASSCVSARVELRKIVWPTREETGMTTLIVFVFVAIAGVFFWGLDLLLAWATRALTGQGG